ncbi:uncharacterized protein YdeI (YjbR/CyaY-like superfamily) [Sphingobium sp. OAS761]|uniref:YdeI/OmpD-associated family protein n=1 Tax=Sphingobium sp. OAS761 TaxID=2817901 RepID=UPI00209E81B8|nr:YdeI/OmpD-associated family protein [Sphingobium sp. OAS761]MCP1468779.1 uncharacterized protein YdeI (YjbR/CyaY-like superfamily) [Sphingobium sp. OAS761]
MARNEQVDAYIAKQADFARPVLSHLRDLVHGTVPDAQEAIKWGMPFFTFRGQNLCNMAGFKAHVAFGFWHDKVAREEASDAAMGQFGRIAGLDDLPPDGEIAALIAQARALIAAGDRPRTGPKAVKAPLPVHPDFAAALSAHAAAATVWAAFPPGKVRDYCEWINEARTEATRNRRIAQAVEWIGDGKGRNWKYEQKAR